MGFHDVPEELQLNELEERLVSLRIPFMQIRELPRGGQVSVKGNIVNVPTDANKVATSLPRRVNDSDTIPVKLKKRLSHKSHNFSQNIRPNKVMKALMYLKAHRKEWQDAGITIDEDWYKQLSDDEKEFIEENPNDFKIWKEDYDFNNENDEDNDHFSEVDENEGVATNTDTLVDQVDYSASSNKEYIFAPGENQKPLNLFDDPDAEYLSFPTIFPEKRPDNKDRFTAVHYSQICKSELRNVDRRVTVPNLFFKLKKLQTKQISDRVSFSMRRKQSQGKNYTAGDLATEEGLKKLSELNDGYQIFSNVRNSPPYLSRRKKDCFAMIRQLGLPTWFLSLSAAETKWLSLLRALGKLVDNKVYDDEYLLNMDWEHKSKLIKADPVTCARFFDNRVQEFINNVLKSPHFPLGKVQDMFLRVEFQQRGSPHIHMMVWLKDAPKYELGNEKEIQDFVLLM